MNNSASPPFFPSHHLSIQNFSFSSLPYVKGRHGIDDGVLNIDDTSGGHQLLPPLAHETHTSGLRSSPSSKLRVIQTLAIYVTCLTHDGVDSQYHAPAPLHSLAPH